MIKEKDFFKAVITMVEDKDLKEFCENKLTKIAEKEEKATAEKVAKAELNKALEDEILDMPAVWFTIKEAKEKFPDTLGKVTSAKVSYILQGLIKDGLIDRKYVKKQPYYKVVTE